MSSIKTVLVANRGEIARRVFATCRRLGIGTVAVFSEPDVGAPFVIEADIAVALGGERAADSYLRKDAVIEAARAAGADAVHPGYGFLAEDAEFARAVESAGLTWIGPSPETIEAMGSKTTARDRMERAGVPVLPGATLAHEIDTEDLLSAAAGVGYPLLVKASFGGGGKGMRFVSAPDALVAAVAAARREAAGAFGNDTVFLEHYATGARHVEIQIFGDRHGCICSLHERDCSVQRRHQKVIEEAPSPAVTPEIRSRMSAAAVAAGRELGYVGAGTVEFLLGERGEFFFLEVNTRLQVEHPVTELITGLDLVELQIRVAEGDRLPDAVLDRPIAGHAVEARLYAEDVAAGFLPAPGKVERLRIAPGVRLDAGVVDGSTISSHYDPMIAKVVAHAETRESAIRKLVAALRDAEILGPTTNRDFLVRVLDHEEFKRGTADTGFLDRHDPVTLAAPLIRDPGLACAAAALVGQFRRRAAVSVQPSLPSGWRNNVSGPQSVVFVPAGGGEQLVVDYRFDRDGRLETLQVAGRELEGPRIHRVGTDSVDLEVGGLRRCYRVHDIGDGAVSVNTSEGQVDLRELPRYPDSVGAVETGSLVSPLPGRVVRVHVEAGTGVEAGQPLLIVEAMKMEHEIVAPHDGVVTLVNVDEGDQVETGTMLVVID